MKTKVLNKCNQYYVNLKKGGFIMRRIMSRVKGRFLRRTRNSSRRLRGFSRRRLRSW